MKIALTSESPIKVKAVREIFKPNYKNLIIETFNTGQDLPSQPINDGGMMACRERIKVLDKKLKEKVKEYDYIISIESSILFDVNKEIYDVVNIILKEKGDVYMITSSFIKIPKLFHRLIEILSRKYTNKKTMIPSFNLTFGQILKEKRFVKDDKNWMKELVDVDRQNQIKDAIIDLLETIQLKKAFKKYPDFPKKGVNFKDINPIFADSKLFDILVNMMVKSTRNTPTKIVGLESRGFILGTALARKLGVGFVPIRKKGKLPGETYSVDYEKEYGVDTFEIQKHSLDKDDNVLIIDDLLATGGSMIAGIKLVRMMGAKLQSCMVIEKVDALYDIAIEQLNKLNLDGVDILVVL